MSPILALQHSTNDDWAHSGPHVMSPALITQLSCARYFGSDFQTKRQTEEMVVHLYLNRRRRLFLQRSSLLKESVCLHVHTDEKCDDNPCYFLSPSLTLSRLFMMTLEHTISFTKRRRTSISQFQTKVKMKCEHFPQLMGSLCQYGKKKTTEPDASSWTSKFRMDGNWGKLQMIEMALEKWTGLLETWTCSTKSSVEKPACTSSASQNDLTSTLRQDLRHHFHNLVSTQVFFYVSVINNTPICTVVLYLSDIPNASMITTETHI